MNIFMIVSVNSWQPYMDRHSCAESVVTMLVSGRIGEENNGGKGGEINLEMHSFSSLILIYS